MKFEIDDKTGMIIKLSFFQKPSKFDGLTSVIPEWGHTIGTSNELEKILQAVKKTQKEGGIENKLQDFIVYDERDGFLIQSIRQHIDVGYPVDLRKPTPREIAYELCG